tara:strand:+ start:205 stop:381 length:177 start_codon:yes stop_codon:yes gene_type:complete
MSLKKWVNKNIAPPKNKDRQMTVSFNSFEEANDFAKLKDGQIFKVKNSWKVRITRRAK